MRPLLVSIYPYVFFLLYLTIPFDDHFRALPNMLLIILGACFPFVVSKNDFFKLKKIPFLVWTLFIAIIFIQALLQGRIQEDWAVLKKILLAGALVLLYLPVQDTKKLNQAVILSSLAAIAYSFIKLPMLIHQGMTFNFLETGNIIEALLVDRIYLGLLSVLAILAGYKLLKKEYDPNNKYYLGTTVLNVLFILLILSRIAIIALVCIFIVSLFYSKKRGPQLLFFAGFLALSVIGIFLFNNDLRKQFFYSNSNYQKEGLVANTLALEPRVVIWDCGWQLAKADGVMQGGMGFSKANSEMMRCYESLENKIKRNWFVKQKYNIHNQYLDLYVGYGVVAFVGFVLMLLLLLIKNRKSFYPTALLVTLILFLGVENMFHRQIGAYYIGFVLLMLLISDTKHTENEGIEP